MKKYAGKDKSEIPLNIFFTRQAYNWEINEITPHLRPMCYCKEILNPCDPVIKCRSCGTYLHKICLKENSEKPCPICFMNIGGVPEATNETRDELVKRPHPEFFSKELQTTVLYYIFQKAIKIENEEKQSLLIIEKKTTSTTNKKAYPTLSPEKATALEKLVERLREHNKINFDRGNDTESKFRSKAKERFMFALV